MKVVRHSLDWVDPVLVASGLKHRAWPLALVAGAGQPEKHGGRWSFVACDPDAREVIERVTDNAFIPSGGPWSAGPVVGLLAYDAGAREATGEREVIWPDLVMARYPAWLAFDHIEQRLWACGWADSDKAARAHADRAASWLSERPAALKEPAAPSASFETEQPPQTYCDAVADVVRRIGEGELFQANIARGWSGDLKPDAEPLDIFLRLSRSRGAAYGAWWQAGDLALVSNSPELFVAFDRLSGRIEARPIKGTRPRYEDPVKDRASGEALYASEKDRAENLMIVDLMRNDLARVSKVGSVKVDRLWELESHPTVHHLTSVVSGRVEQGLGWADVLSATFPPGSITGAPKHQAMKVIAAHEPSRGAWCGSLFVQDMAGEGQVTASVLIRTASLQRMDGRWHWRALAGAGITADSDPVAELEETEAKIAALRAALSGGV